MVLAPLRVKLLRYSCGPLSPQIGVRGLSATQVKLGQQLIERGSFSRKAMAGRGGLLDHGCILLSSLVHHVNRGVDLLQSGGLLTR